MHPALNRTLIFAICLVLIRGPGNMSAAAAFRKFLDGGQLPKDLPDVSQMSHL
jgi:hypothetical protein